MATVTALAAYPPVYAGGGGILLAVPGALAGAAVLGALATRTETPALVAVVLLGGAYAGALFLRGPELDARVPLYALLLALLPELVAWSAQSATRVEAEPALARVRLASLAAALAVSGAAAAAVVGVSVVGTSGGLAWEAAGVAAAVAMLALLAAVARRA